VRVTFWALWAIDALIGVIALFFFVAGLADGSVSSFNMGIWMAILAALAVVVGGSLGLRALGRPGLGSMLLLVLAVPGVLYAVFLLAVIMSGTSWN
jgi:hypothetical protein